MRFTTGLGFDLDVPDSCAPSVLQFDLSLIADVNNQIKSD